MSNFKQCLGFEVDSIFDLWHIVKSQGFQHFTNVTHWVSYQRKTWKIIIETSLEHLVFVCKYLAILKKRFGLAVDEYSKLDHIIWIWNHRACQYEIIITYHKNINLSGMTTDSFSFDTEIKELKITKQISNWMRILEIGCKCQTAEGLVLWKHLPAAIRYQDTLLISPLIFCSASVLWSSLSLSYVLISPGSISKLEHSY